MAQIMEIVEAVKQEQYRKTTAIPFGFEGNHTLLYATWSNIKYFN
jgi:hemerythrin superfamily protein